MIRRTASATTDSQAVPERAPSAKVTSRGAAASSWGVRVGGVVMPAALIVVTQVRSPRRPTTTSGTTSTLSPGSSAKANEPKQTRPVPGSATSSRTTAERA